MTTKELVTGKNESLKKTLFSGGIVVLLVTVLAGAVWLLSHTDRNHAQQTPAPLADGKMAVTQQIYEKATPEDGLVQVGDIVKLIGISGKGSVYPAELEYVEVLHVFGRDEKVSADGAQVRDGFLTLQLSCSDEQLAKLYELRESYSITVAIVSRGDPARAQELLAQQEEILQQLQKETGGSTAEEGTEKPAEQVAPQTPAVQPAA